MTTADRQITYIIEDKNFVLFHRAPPLSITFHTDLGVVVSVTERQVNYKTYSLSLLLTVVHQLNRSESEGKKSVGTCVCDACCSMR